MISTTKHLFTVIFAIILSTGCAIRQTPYSLEDVNPFTHIEGPDWLWRSRLNLPLIRDELENFSSGDKRIITLDLIGYNLVSRAFSKLIPGPSPTVTISYFDKTF